MPPKQPAKTSKVTIALHDVNFRRSMFFNRYSIERVDGHALIDFGLVTSRFVVDSYSVLIDQETLKMEKDSMLAYLGQIGAPNAPVEGGAFIHGERKVDASNCFLMSRSGEIGEIRIGLFSIGIVLEKKTATPETFEATPLALLRCDANLQRNLLTDLYKEELPDVDADES
jgi:hypothetical protein